MLGSWEQTRKRSQIYFSILNPNFFLIDKVVMTLSKQDEPTLQKFPLFQRHKLFSTSMSINWIRKENRWKSIERQYLLGVTLGSWKSPGIPYLGKSFSKWLGGPATEKRQALECYKGDFILDFGERIQHPAPLWLAKLSTTQPYLECKGTKTTQYRQAIYTQFKWNFSKLRKCEVYSVHMLYPVFIPSLLTNRI